MDKEILVNVGPLESRVAIMEDGRLAEMHLEREPRVVGNIYKARVASILGGMEAAFVDIGLEKHAFLSADDVGYSRDDPEKDEKEEKQEEQEEKKEETKGRGRRTSRQTDTGRRSGPFADLKVGQELLVQVNRAAVGTKGARVSTRLALPGRYLVLLITDPGRVGVSRKIESEKVRKRLKELGEELCPEGHGMIVRTEAEGARRTQLAQDLQLLMEMKDRIFAKAAETSAPALIHEDLSLVFQVIRDSFTRDVSKLLIDNEKAFEGAREVVATVAPRLKSRVTLYKGKDSLFEHYGVEDEIGKLWQRKVWLKVGGYISIDQTEALCAIDVNTARFTGRARTGLEETIFRTNLEAAEEIARQLRLRDIGGIIVIDFIDMEVAAHRNKVLSTLNDALKNDRAKTRALSISPLGLAEMTRKKHGESLLEKISDICPECNGLGRVQNPVSIFMHISRELRQHKPGVGAFAVWAHPRVACMLIGTGGEQLRQLEASLHRPIHVRARGEEPADFEVAVVTPGKLQDKVKLFQPGNQLQCRRLGPNESGLNGEIALSEEGYLVELEQSARGYGETFTVELLEAGTSLGWGRIISAPLEAVEIEQAQPQAPRGTGIRRRGMRRRERDKVAKGKEEKKPTPAAAEPKPSRAAKPDEATPPAAAEAGEAGKKRPRRRRRGKHDKQETVAPQEMQPVVEEVSEPAATTEASSETEVPHKPAKRRRRRHHKKPVPVESEPGIQAGEAAPVMAEEPAESAAIPAEASTEETEPVHKRRPRRRRRHHKKPEGEAMPESSVGQMETQPEPAMSVPVPEVAKEQPVIAEAPKKQPRRRSRRPAKKTTEPEAPQPQPELPPLQEPATNGVPEAPAPAIEPTGEPAPKPRRRYYRPRKKKTEAAGE
jgi:ribonuclease G